MARIRCRFLGARPLRDGSLTGMVIFENVTNADRHSLIDLEGEVYLTNEDNIPQQYNQSAMFGDALKRISDILVDVFAEASKTVEDEQG